jgi:hypothetical protein
MMTKRCAARRAKSTFCSTRMIVMPMLAVEPDDRLLDLLDDVGLDALGRLVEQDDPGLAASARRDRQLLLLAARETPPMPVEASREHREELEASRVDLARRSGARRCRVRCSRAP